jgi:hypothetical protein
MVMDKESILVYSDERGFGEVYWLTCPVCWNSMRLVRWEGGLEDEDCAACRVREEGRN